jgi:hypothetical protein
MMDLGTSKSDILNKGFDIVKELDGKRLIK